MQNNSDKTDANSSGLSCNRNPTNSYQDLLHIFLSSPNQRNISTENFKKIMWPKANKEMKHQPKIYSEKYEKENVEETKIFGATTFWSTTVTTPSLDMRVYCRGRLIYDPQDWWTPIICCYFAGPLCTFNFYQVTDFRNITCLTRQILLRQRVLRIIIMKSAFLRKSLSGKYTILNKQNDIN